MPVVLLQVDGADTASPTLAKLAQSLSGTERALSSAGTAGSLFATQMNAMERNAGTAGTAISDFTSKLRSVNTSFSTGAGAMDRYLSSMDRLTPSLRAVADTSAMASYGLADMNTAIRAASGGFSSGANAINRYLASMDRLEKSGASGSSGIQAIVDQTRQLNVTLGDSMIVIDAYTTALANMDRAAMTAAASMRLFNGAGMGGANGIGGSAASDARSANLGVRTAGLGLSENGSFRAGALTGGAGALGGISLPIIIAAIGGYLGFKAVSSANDYNQSISDIIAQSTQNTSQIPGLAQGILNLTGGNTGNRFSPQQLTQAAYPVESSPLFAKLDDALAAIKVISDQSQASGAKSLQPLALADVGAVSAYALGANAMRFVADTITKGVNIGLAETPDFAKGISTYAQSSIVADPNRVRAFQQSVGAYAQNTNLSTRFRFDAQAENAFYGQVNGRQSRGAAQIEQDLGISSMFGPGGVGRAGGLASWLKELNNVTAGPNQAAYLQAIFPRQNALQFVRGFTGQNFMSGQDMINGTLNAGGASSRTARISDAGPQAQTDKLIADFNKSVIEVGTTISKTLQPDLLMLGTGAFTAGKKLGDLAGAIGNAIDDISRKLNLPVNAPKVAGDVWSFLGKVGNAADKYVPGGSTLLATAGYSAIPQAFQYFAQNGVQNPFNSHPFQGVFDTRSAALNVGAGLSVFRPTTFNWQFSPQQTATRPGIASGGSEAAGVTGTGWVIPDIHQASMAEGFGSQGVNPQQFRANQAKAAYDLLVANGGTNAKQLQSDRGSINYDLATGASADTINKAIKKLADDLKSSGMTITDQRNYLEKYSVPAQNQIRAYRAADWQTKSDTLQGNLQNAQLMGASPADQKKIYDQFIADQRQVILNNTKPGSADQNRQLSALGRQKNAQDYAYDQQTKANHDQTALDTAQSNLTSAQQLGAPPAMLRTLEQAQLAAQRQQAIDNTTPGAARDKQLAAINQQGKVFDYGQKVTAVQGALKDLQNTASIDQLNGNLGQYSRDMQAVVRFESAHKKELGLSDSDIKLLSAQIAAGATQTNPVTNLHPFFQQNPGLGALQAGWGSSDFRLGGGEDPSTMEIRALKAIISSDNNKMTGYLREIAELLAAAKGQTARAPAKRSYRTG